MLYNLPISVNFVTRGKKGYPVCLISEKHVYQTASNILDHLYHWPGWFSTTAYCLKCVHHGGNRTS